MGSRQCRTTPGSGRGRPPSSHPTGSTNREAIYFGSQFRQEASAWLAVLHKRTRHATKREDITSTYNVSERPGSGQPSWRLSSRFRGRENHSRPATYRETPGLPSWRRRGPFQTGKASSRAMGRLAGTGILRFGRWLARCEVPRSHTTHVMCCVSQHQTETDSHKAPSPGHGHAQATLELYCRPRGWSWDGWCGAVEHRSL